MSVSGMRYDVFELRGVSSIAQAKDMLLGSPDIRAFGDIETDVLRDVPSVYLEIGSKLNAFARKHPGTHMTVRRIYETSTGVRSDDFTRGRCTVVGPEPSSRQSMLLDASGIMVLAPHSFAFTAELVPWTGGPAVQLASRRGALTLTVEELEEPTALADLERVFDVALDIEPTRLDEPRKGLRAELRYSGRHRHLAKLSQILLAGGPSLFGAFEPFESLMSGDHDRSVRIFGAQLPIDMFRCAASVRSRDSNSRVDNMNVVVNRRPLGSGFEG